MLYTKNINDITWENVEDFCNQEIAEGATLDYKKYFPKDLAKTIAAFANTMGGIILIGVDENDENKPIVPIFGIDNQRGLSERVMSIILSNITPPIIPEIQVCANEDKTKATILIRIHQSDLTPHAINDNTKVYIRTGNRSHSEELVNLEKLNWLLNNRQKSNLLSNNILSEALKRFEKYYQKEIVESVKQYGATGENQACKLTLILQPKFPQEILCEPPKLSEIKQNIYVKDYFGTSYEFPIDRGRFDSKIHQTGIHGGLFHENHAYYYELNQFGLYFYHQHLFGKFPFKYGTDQMSFRFNEIIARLDQFIQSANKFYDQINFIGLLKFELSLTGINNFLMRPYIEAEFKETFEESCYHQSSFLTKNLESDKKEIIFDAIKKIAWAYNWDLKHEYLDFYAMKFQAL